MRDLVLRLVAEYDGLMKEEEQRHRDRLEILNNFIRGIQSHCKHEYVRSTDTHAALICEDCGKII